MDDRPHHGRHERAGAPIGPIPAGSLVVNAKEAGLAGDGVTNDQPALAELVASLGAAHDADGIHRVVYCPPGVYAIRDTGTVWRNGVSLIGAGIGATRFTLANPGDRSDPTPLAFHTARLHGASRENALVGCTFAGFEIDGSGVELEEYSPLAKGLGLQYVLRGRFRDLYIHDTAATGFGCDFLQDTVVEGVVAVGCGRLDRGLDMGGAGIGIGIGGWGTTERLTVIACTAVNSGTNGIFVELQSPEWTPPRGIRISDCQCTGNLFGISDWGADGLIVSGCTMNANREAGYDVSVLGTSSVAGRGGIVTDCVIDANLQDGVSIADTPGPYVVRGNRIGRNGRYGFREHELMGRGEATREIVVEGNDIFDNGLDGVHIGGTLRDAFLVGNRIRGNGRRTEPRAAGEGDAVRYTDTSLRDASARWRPDGHRGKKVTVGAQITVVVTNTVNELVLATYRPAETTAWREGVPSQGASYALPPAPEVRAGITLAAPSTGLTVRGNRVWDGDDPATQTHGLNITDLGRCTDCRIEDNDLAGNAVAAGRFDGAPRGGSWERNRGLMAPPAG